MPRNLRRRSNMELAPIANIRETDVEEVPLGNGSNNPRQPFDDGVDDGFDTPSEPRPTNGGVPRTPFPRSPSPGNEGGRGGYIPVPTDPSLGSKPGRKPLNVNTYATKKTVAQGMMDLALLTANANQLRYVIEAGKFGNLGINYHVSISLICISIILQLGIGVALIFMGRYDVSREHHAAKADSINNWVVLGVFLITIINVFISSFAIEPMSPALIRSALIESIDPVTERLIEH